jgi:hypothetical protein
MKLLKQGIVVLLLAAMFIAVAPPKAEAVPFVMYCYVTRGHYATWSWEWWGRLAMGCDNPLTDITMEWWPF